VEIVWVYWSCYKKLWVGAFKDWSKRKKCSAFLRLFSAKPSKTWHWQKVKKWLSMLVALLFIIWTVLKLMPSSWKDLCTKLWVMKPRKHEKKESNSYFADEEVTWCKILHKRKTGKVIRKVIRCLIFLSFLFIKLKYQ